MKAFDSEAVQNLAASAELRRKESEERKICVVCRIRWYSRRIPRQVGDFVTGHQTPVLYSLSLQTILYAYTKARNSCLWRPTSTDAVVRTFST